MTGRRTVTVTAELRRHPRPILATLGLIFGALCLWFGGPVWLCALILGVILVDLGVWR
jgi:hypothetical protein